MTFDEWHELARGLKKIYYSKNFLESDEVVRAWYYSLKEFDTDYVRKACRKWYDSEKGKKFYPRLIELYNLAEEIKSELQGSQQEQRYVFGKLTLHDCYDKLYLLRLELQSRGITLNECE